MSDSIMSAPSTPPPLPQPSPARVRQGGSGCLPFFVFVLVLVLAACVFLRNAWPNLPREYAGQVVVEVLDSPSPEQMKTCERRVLSSTVLMPAIRNSGFSGPLVEEEVARLRQAVEVKAKGPFLTITVRGGKRELHRMASIIASAFEEDLREEAKTEMRLRSQALEAHTNLKEEDREKARLTLIEITKKLGLQPDGSGGPDPALQKLVSTKLAKLTVDLAALEERRKVISGDDLYAALLLALQIPNADISPADPGLLRAATLAAAAKDAPPEAAANLDALKKALTEKLAVPRSILERDHSGMALDLRSLTAQREKMQQEALMAESRRGEWLAIKAEFDRADAMLNKLKEEQAQARVDHSVVLRPVRIADAAAEVRVPARKTLRGLKAAAAVCAVLLIASLLAAITSRLCRRCA